MNKDKSSTKKTKIHRQKAYELSLTKFELLHLRDVMSVLLPPSGDKTMSQALAELEDRSVIESMLWQKVSQLCAEANLPLNDEAPDYIVAPTTAPPMGIFHINHDVSQQEPSSQGFLSSEDDSEDQQQQEDGDEED